MSRDFRLAILSDVHYAAAAEQVAGDDYEIQALPNPCLRLLVRGYRRYIWLRHPLRHNGQLDRFLAEVGPVDYVIANGDYSCNVAAVGVGDEAAFQSARECLDRLRARFGDRLLANLGDHELGKLRLMGRRGGMRLASWRRATQPLLSVANPSPRLADMNSSLATAADAEPGLGLRSFWRLELGNYVLVNVVSTLAALPVFERDMLPAERPAWEKLREAHLAEVRAAFTALEPRQRVLLFCHDPTALPFLWRDDAIREKLPQLEQTIIGHLHSNLFLRMSRFLSGMPVLNFLGGSVRKLSTALHQARDWRPFRVRLCPSLAGIELLKDGGYLTVDLDAEARRPARFQFHPLPR